MKRINPLLFFLLTIVCLSSCDRSYYKKVQREAKELANEGKTVLSQSDDSTDSIHYIVYKDGASIYLNDFDSPVKTLVAKDLKISSVDLIADFISDGELIVNQLSENNNNVLSDYFNNPDKYEVECIKDKFLFLSRKENYSNYLICISNPNKVYCVPEPVFDSSGNAKITISSHLSRYPFLNYRFSTEYSFQCFYMGDDDLFSWEITMNANGDVIEKDENINYSPSIPVKAFTTLGEISRYYMPLIDHRINEGRDF